MGNLRQQDLSPGLELHLKYHYLERDMGKCKACQDTRESTKGKSTYCVPHAERKLEIDLIRLSMLRNRGAFAKKEVL